MVKLFTTTLNDLKTQNSKHSCISATNSSLDILFWSIFLVDMGRFMKLRLDRVLAESYEANSIEEALASTPTNLEFETPENWVAPYSKYEYGWWEAFLPPATKAEAKV